MKNLTPKIENKPLTMNFYDALKEVYKGNSITRISWSNNDYCLLKNGWLTIFTGGNFHEWLIIDGDMEGEDWIIVLGLN